MRGDAYGRELLNAADGQTGRHFSSSQQPSNMSIRNALRCNQRSRSPPMAQHTRPLAVDLRIVGQLALTGCRTAHAAEWPAPSSAIDRCSPLDEHDRTVADNLALPASDRRSASMSFPVARGSTAPDWLFKARSCHTMDRMWNLVVANSLERVAITCDDGIEARSIPSFWIVASRQTGMRHDPNENHEKYPRRRLHPTYAEGFCAHGE